MEDEARRKPGAKEEDAAHGLLISAGILAVFALWLLSTFLSRRR